MVEGDTQLTKKRPVLPVFAPFVSAVETELRFLEEDFGLVREEVRSIPPECVVGYRGDGLRVVAYYEYGTPPWISVALKDDQEGWKDVAIDWLKAAAAKESQKSGWSGSEDDMNRAVAAQAAALRSVLPGLSRGGMRQVDRALERSRKDDCKAALRLLEALEQGDASGFPAKDQAYLSSLKRSLQACDSNAMRKHLDSKLQLRHEFSPSTLRKKGVKQQLAELTIAVQDCLQ